MKWSWKIANVAGIDVFIHSTFFILIGWIGLTYWRAEKSISAVFEGIGFILALFGCVLLHELGHALAARRYGIVTRDITLLPIGGVARLERMPEDPKQELVVALAGPLVNVIIAAALWVILSLSGVIPVSESGLVAMTEGPFLVRLMFVNVVLAVFNLLPAFPMDGGRVLRAILACYMDYSIATQKAASVGQAMALMFGFLGLLSNPFLLFIALFVWIGAAQEASMVQIRSAIGGIPVSGAMLTNFQTLDPTDSLEKAIELTLSGSQKDFPVTENGRVVGVLTQADMLAAIASQGPSAQVSQSMQKKVQHADSHEMLDSLLQRLEDCDCKTLPVTHDGRLVGVVTMDNLGEFLRIQSAIGSANTVACTADQVGMNVLPLT